MNKWQNPNKVQLFSQSEGPPSIPNASFVVSYDTMGLDLRSAVCKILHYLAVQVKHLFQVTIIPGNRYFRLEGEKFIFQQLLTLGLNGP